MAQAPPPGQHGCQAGRDDEETVSSPGEHACGAAPPTLHELAAAADGSRPSAAARLKSRLAVRWQQLPFRMQNAMLAFVIGGLMFFTTLLIMAGSLLAPAYLVSS